MLNSFEVPLWQAIAIAPNENAKYLASPSAGNFREWIQTPLAKNIFTRVAYLVINNQHISFLSILTAPVSRELHPEVYDVLENETKYLADLWNEGKQKPSHDLPFIVSALRDNYIVKESEKEMDSCKSRNRADQSSAVNNLTELSSILGTLAHYGALYNPDPVSHLNDPEVTISGTWGCNIFDNLFDGGVPSGGYSLCVAPTGFGKTTLGLSYAIYSITSKMTSAVCTNEMSSGDISRRVKRALMTMWAGTRDEADIERDMRTYMRVYDRVFDWERLENIAYTEHPRILVIDSLDNLTYPPESRSMPIDEKHKARANGIAGMSSKYGSFISVVGNASGEQQSALREGVEKVSSARAFGSAWYENMAYWSSVMSRDKVQSNVSNVRRCKNRQNGRIGEIWKWAYDSQGAYYKDCATVVI